ncbi:MAG: hypothetical protein NVS9B3_08680 [Gemmatimonadaceae bacterium]
MTLDAWLAARTPVPPPALARRLGEILGAESTSDAGAAHLQLAAAAERVLIRLLKADCSSRASALDLLVADALMTYAFESAADHPASIDASASAAMRRIARLGASEAP